MITFDKVKGHLKTINDHKAKVMELCFKCGLYKQGLKHDLSKYTWTELKTGFNYYQGFRSPINAQKEEQGYSMSWLQHKGRNPHHWEYWLDNSPNGVIAVKMPFEYVAENFCDRVAASMIYQKENYRDDSALKYFEDSLPALLLHPETKRQLHFLLRYLKDHGLDKTMRQLKKWIKEYRKTGKDPI